MASFAAGRGAGITIKEIKAAGKGMQNIRVIFFDNDEQNVKDMSIIPNCKSVYVDDHVKLNEPSSGTEYMKNLVTPDNIYAENNTNESYISNGITDEIILTQLIPWITETQGIQNRFAVFDWDRTISVVEGLAIPTDFEGIDENKFIADMTTYVLGGEPRKQMLKSMFQNIIASGTQVVILTNNPAALPNTPQRDTFLKMIKIIFPEFVDDNLLCSNGYLNKPEKFKEYLIHSKLYGGKKKRTKRRRKTRRNTKRRKHR